MPILCDETRLLQIGLIYCSRYPRPLERRTCRFAVSYHIVYAPDTYRFNLALSQTTYTFTAQLIQCPCAKYCSDAAVPMHQAVLQYVRQKTTSDMISSVILILSLAPSLRC